MAVRGRVLTRLDTFLIRFRQNDPWLRFGWVVVLCLALVIIFGLAWRVSVALGQGPGAPLGFTLAVLAGAGGIVLVGAALGSALPLGRDWAYLTPGHALIVHAGPALGAAADALQQSAGDGPVRVTLIGADDRLPPGRQRLGATLVHVASGDVADPRVLVRHGIDTARAAVVVSPSLPPESADDAVLRAIMALIADGAAPRPRVAAELRVPSNVRTAAAIDPDRVWALAPDDLIARVFAQAVRDPAALAVHKALFDPRQIQLLARPPLGLVGNRFGDAAMGYEFACLVGLVDAGGRAYFLPHPDTVIAQDMQTIILAEAPAIDDQSDDHISLDLGALRLTGAEAGRRETVLVIGWHARAAAMLDEWARVLPSGSALVIVLDDAATEAELASAVARLPATITAYLAVQPLVTRADFEMVDLAPYSRILVLADGAQSDARTLARLAHLRDMLGRREAAPRLMAEIVDPANAGLARRHADAVLVAADLCGTMLARGATAPLVASFCNALADPGGIEAVIRPVTDYVDIDRMVNFYTLTEATQRRGEVVLGTIRRDELAFTPEKAAPLVYEPGDRVVVLRRR